MVVVVVVVVVVVEQKSKKLSLSSSQSGGSTLDELAHGSASRTYQGRGCQTDVVAAAALVLGRTCWFDVVIQVSRDIRRTVHHCPALSRPPLISRSPVRQQEQTC